MLLKVPVTARDHVHRAGRGAVTLLEYGDYQCPHCGRAHPVVEELLQKYAGRLRLVYRHFPLMKMHPQAKLAAEAAEAAGGAGGERQILGDAPSAVYPSDAACSRGPPAVRQGRSAWTRHRFEQDLIGHVYGPRVQEDLAGGMRTGVNGTPSFFINGRRYTGPKDVPGLTAAVEEAVKARGEG